MAKKGTAEIRINRRTLRIAHEVYPLANISRVRSVQIVYRKTAWHALGSIVVTLVVVAVGWSLLRATGPTDSEELAQLLLVIAGLYLTYLLAVLVHRLLRRPIFSLMIETAGTQFTLLSSHELSTIRLIEDAVVDAIENPPEQERILHVGDVIVGDKFGGSKIQQSGIGNTFNAN